MNYLMQEVQVSVKNALEEDIGTGDITSLLTIPDNQITTAKIIAKESGVISGMLPVKHILDEYSFLKYTLIKEDGDKVKKGDVILELHGHCQEILKLERTILNYLQQLSGTATLTNTYVTIAKKYSVAILDTRKTIPGLRYLQKKAVVDGGGENHRTGLFDAILIKENHIKAAGGIKNAIQNINNSAEFSSLKDTSGFFLEIETETFDEVKEACPENPDIILLDNMTDSITQKCINYIKHNYPNIKTEISGGVDENTLETKAQLLPDRISIGQLTHSAKTLDLSLLLS
jgi:nicotinate-nucleotide pyrophosphorylase (carboxylating)